MTTKQLQISILNSRPFHSILTTAILLLLPFAVLCAEPPQKRLSLQESVSIALDNASSLKKASNLVRLEGADVLRSYGGFLPRLSVSAGYVPYSVSRSYTQLSGTETVKLKSEQETLNLTLTTSLNLFNGFRDYAALQAALNNEQGAGFSLFRARQAVVFDVTQSYYQVLLNEEILAIARENLLTAKDQLTLTERQFQIGLKSMPDLYQQQAETASSELAVNQADAQLERSRLELLRRLRIDPRTKLLLEPVSKETLSPEPLKTGIDSLIAQALLRRDDLKSKKLETDAAGWQIRQAAASWYPKLDLNFNVSTSGVESLRQTYTGDTFNYSYPPLGEQLENSIGYSVSLNFSWALFDGFQTRYNVEQAKINQINQRLDYEDLHSDIALDLQQAVTDYSSAFTRIESAKVGLKAAKSAYESIKRKYDLGASGFIELSTARAALFSAMSTLSQATYNLALQKNVLDFTSGTLSTR